ncbi:MAG: hypothetical protein AAGU19_22600 [Prolixibacteraceae bacterium]
MERSLESLKVNLNKRILFLVLLYSCSTVIHVDQGAIQRDICSPNWLLKTLPTQPAKPLYGSPNYREKV